MGPGDSTTCRACGGKVGVPYWSVVAVIPFLAAIPLAELTDMSDVLKIAALIVGFAIMSVIHMKLVPLIPR